MEWWRAGDEGGARGDRASRAGAPQRAEAARFSAPWFLWLGVTLAISTVAGAAAARLGVPLPWILGPLAVSAAGSIAGLPLRPVPMGRELGQVVVGIAIGLRFTPPVVAATVTLLPAMAVATIYVIAVTTIAAFMLRPLGRMDQKTAFFATAAAGMADMATVAQQRGGDPSAVSIVHAIRVAGVVTAVPVLVTAFGDAGGILPEPPGADHGLLALALVLALGVLAARIIGLTPFPNPWLVGPIIASAALVGTGLLAVAVPQLLMIVAQIMIGLSLGCRFRRELLLQLPRVVGAALLITLYLILAAALGGAVLSWTVGLPFATGFLAVAPAGITEMVLTATVMQLDATVVTAFHVMRIAVIAATILLTFRLYQRLSRWAHGSGV